MTRLNAPAPEQDGRSSRFDPRVQEAELGLVDEVEQTREELRDKARATLGVTGDENTGKLRGLLRTYDTSVYPLFALGLLSVTDLFQSYAFSVLAPDIARSLGISFGAIAGVAALRGVAVAVAPLPMAWLSQRAARRALLCLVTAIGWSVLTLYTGLVTSVVGLLLILIADGLSTGSVASLHAPLLMDSYHPTTRVRVVSAYTAITRFGEVVAPLLVALLAGPLDLTWRGVFIGLGIVSTLTTLLSLRLRDPGYGRWDTQQLRKAVHDKHGDDAALNDDDVSLGFWEICQRLMLIPTIRRLLAGLAMIGVLSAPLGVFLAPPSSARAAPTPTPSPRPGAPR